MEDGGSDREGRPVERRSSSRNKRPSPERDINRREHRRARRGSTGSSVPIHGSISIGSQTAWYEEKIGEVIDVPQGAEVSGAGRSNRRWTGGLATIVMAYPDHMMVLPVGANAKMVTPIRVDFARGQRRRAAAGLTPYTVPSQRSRSTSPTPRGSPDATPRPATKQMQVDGADSRSEQESSPEESPVASTEIQMGMSPAQDAVEEPQDSWGHGPEAEGESVQPNHSASATIGLKATQVRGTTGACVVIAYMTIIAHTH